MPAWILFYVIFLLMLAGLLALHRRKLTVAALGFLQMCILFIGIEGLKAFGAHITEHHRVHLMFNLALLIPGFALVAYYFEHSGFSVRMARSWFVRGDQRLLWTVFAMSMGLDNIAACMIGGILLQARYGEGNAPFRMLIGIIGAANLGGSGSFLGDTTTVMMAVAGIPELTLAKAYVAALPAQILLGLWAQAHDRLPPSVESAEDTFGEGAKPLPPAPVTWGMFAPILLGIACLIVANFRWELPGPGLWVGIVVGCVAGRVPLHIEALWFIGGHEKEEEHLEAPEEREEKEEETVAGGETGAAKAEANVPEKGEHAQSSTISNTLFLLLLVGAAELLPLDKLKVVLAFLGPDQIAYAMGALSPWFDNIPLTALSLKLGGFDWGLLAYAVGFAGSAIWFGSTAGVSLGTTFPEVYETKRWLGWTGPFVVLMGIYTAGFLCYLLVFRVLIA